MSPGPSGRAGAGRGKAALKALLNMLLIVAGDNTPAGVCTCVCIVGVCVCVCVCWFYRLSGTKLT